MSRPLAPLRPSLALLCLALLGPGCSQGSGDETRGSQPPPPVSAAPGAEDGDAARAGSPAPDAAKAPVPSPEPEAVPAKPPEPTFGPAKLSALSGEQRETLMLGDQDPPIPVDTHYIQSNETRHDLYFPYLAPDNEPIGGAFIGVGSDQSFTLIAKARSELAFLMDIDTRVVDLHESYVVFITESDTPEALLARWDKANQESSAALLEEKLADKFSKKRLGRILRGYAANRETVFRHLGRVIARTRDGAQTSWLSDPENYAHIRALHQTGRIRIMQGNLAGETSLRTAAAAADALGITMRVLYMSNAEEYFKYTGDFVANVAAQKTDEKGVVLRTIYSKKWEHADLWAYQVQPLQDFQERLADRKIRARTTMLRFAKRDKQLEKIGGTGFSKLGF